MFDKTVEEYSEKTIAALLYKEITCKFCRNKMGLVVFNNDDFHTSCYLMDVERKEERGNWKWVKKKKRN